MGRSLPRGRSHRGLGKAARLERRRDLHRAGIVADRDRQDLAAARGNAKRCHGAAGADDERLQSGAAVIGLLAKDAIDVMLESPLVVAGALIVGGIAILVLEKIIPARPDHGVAALSWKSCLTIGLVQCLAMVPGTSRSAATIMGALAMGVGRKTAAEFSFFLAVPTMLGAATVKILDEPALLAGEAAIGWTEIALGFVAAFLVALAVIRAFVAYVSKHGFAPFAWYRIALGLVAVWFFAIA